MKKLFLHSLFIILISIPVLGQTQFYSKGSLNVNELSSWSSTPDGTGTSPANFTTLGQVFYVQANHSMTASADWMARTDTASKVVIKSNGTITSGSFNHTLNLFMESGAKWVQTGDTYANVLFRYLNPKSIFQIDNAASFIGSKVYGTLFMNGVNIRRASFAYTYVNGDFLLSGATLGCDTAHNFRILGDTYITNSTWDISKGNVILYGNLYNNGTIISTRPSVMSINDPAELDWGTMTVDSLQITFYNTAVSVFKSGLSFGSACNWNISSGAVVDPGSFVVSGGANFNTSQGSTFKSGHPSGLDGNIAVTGNKNLNANVTYEFNGSAAQVTGSLLPSTITGTLRINNSNGVTLSKSTTATNVEITAGNLDLDNKNLTVTNLNITSPSASNMIIADGGELRKVFTENGSFTFPIGDNTGSVEYSPVTVNMTSGTYNNAYVSARVINTKHPNNTSAGNYINRYWRVNQSGITNPVYNIDLFYADGDVAGNKSDLWGGRWNGLSWLQLNSANPAENKLSGTGLTSFSDFTGGEAAALPVELTSFTAKSQGTTVNLMWETKTEIDNNGFEVERNSHGTWQKIGFIQGHGTANSPKYYTFTDNNATGNKIQYRLKQIDNDGTFEYSPEVEVELNPMQFALYQNYPNPFNPSTVIRYALPVAGLVTIDIFNALGEKVSTLLNGYADAGYHQIPFDAAALPGGVYFYRIQSGEFTAVKKMALVK